MMRWLQYAWICVALCITRADALDDPGKEVVGTVAVTVIHATDKEVSGGRKLDGELEKRLRADQKLRFKHFYQLGTEQRPLFRSYENWSQPLQSSDDVLLRFDLQGQPSADQLRIDLEFWLARKKMLKTDVEVTRERPLFVLGPEWRGGRILIAVALAKPQSPKP